MGFIYRFAGRWPNGVIPYRAINTWDLSSPLRRIDKALTLPPAILEYQNKTAIEFVPWSGETDYVTFTGEIDTAALSGWCQSTADLFTPAYGKMGGEQTVWCKSFGTDPNSPSDVHIRTTIHEMGHVIGLYHEHQRPDRDSYVSVTGFDPLNLSIITGDTSFSVGDFDCGSVMLYTSINSCTPTSGSSCLGSCVGVPIPGWSAGAPLSLTDGDIASVNFLYPTKSKSSFSWSADWMVTKPVYLGQANDAYAFWYNPNSNSFVISKLIKNGETVVYQSTLSSSATSLVSFKRGSHGYVMAYDKATGNASIYQLRPPLNSKSRMW
jgi:hypothetical protein